MRFLFATYPSPAHFFPMVPLGWALRAAGHEVLVATSPAFTEVVKASGLPAVVTGPDVDVAAVWGTVGLDPTAATSREDHVRLRSAKAIEMFATVADAMVDGTLALAERWQPDLVVFESRAYAGPIVAARLGIPSARQLYGTDYTYSRWDFEGPFVAKLWERRGWDPADPHGTLTVDPCPPSMQVPDAAPERQPMRYVPYNGPALRPDWLDEPPARPRVCVTYGTTFAKLARNLSPAVLAVEALRGLDVEIVAAISASQRELLGDVPGVRVVTGMPLHLLLPTCSAVVHQGGAGTTLTSAVCAVPQFVVPSIGDEPLNARRIAATGAADYVDQHAATPEAIRDGVRRLLGDAAYRTAARRVQQENLLQPSPVEVAERLVRLALGAPEPASAHG